MSVSEPIEVVAEECSATNSKRPVREKCGPKSPIERARLKVLMPALLAAGKTVAEISQELQLHSNTVRQWSKELLEKYPELMNVGEYEQNRADLISAIEGKALKSIHDKITDAHVKDATLAFKVLHSAGRLERGLSSTNISQKVDISFTAVNPAHISDSDDD